MFDVLDEDGKLTGLQKSKEEILSGRHYRLVTHAWVINEKGELLAQQRASHKGLWDNLWDVTVGGGVASGEKSRDACVRELKEELSLLVDPKELIFAGRFRTTKPLPERGINAYEFSDTFIIKREVEITDLRLRAEEVSAIELVAVESAGDNTSRLWVPHPQSYYAGVLQKCSELL